VAGLARASYTFGGASVTATVQGWATGQSNNGWVLWHGLNNGWNVSTGEAVSLATRPLLSVTYKALVDRPRGRAPA